MRRKVWVIEDGKHETNQEHATKRLVETPHCHIVNTRESLRNTKQAWRENSIKVNLNVHLRVRRL